MAWISSQSFYNRLIRSQLHNVAQIEQFTAASNNMQDEIEALIDERDELSRWKEAHLNERKDSGLRGCRELQAKNRDLGDELAESKRECMRLRDENVHLDSVIKELAYDKRQKDKLHESFKELRASHDELKKSNLEMETHFIQDLRLQKQACEELERSRNALQDGVDEGMSVPSLPMTPVRCRLTGRTASTRLQAHKTKICKLIHECGLKDAEITKLTSRLRTAWEDGREMHQSRAELESRLEQLSNDLLIRITLSDQRETIEKEKEELRSKYELLLEKHAFAAEGFTTNNYLDGFDSFSDGMLRAILVFLIAFMIFGVVTGKLT